jgi:hypothetical protein
MLAAAQAPAPWRFESRRPVDDPSVDEPCAMVELDLSLIAASFERRSEVAVAMPGVASRPGPVSSD